MSHVVNRPMILIIKKKGNLTEMKSKRRNIICSITMGLIICFLSSIIAAADVPEGMPLKERIDRIEEGLGIFTEEDTLIERISYLEIQCFGDAKTGDLPSRIEKLEAIVYGETTEGSTDVSSVMPKKARTDGVLLTDMDYFSKDPWVNIGYSDEDSFGNQYGVTIAASQGSMDSSVKNLKYYLGGEYSELQGTLFIPKAANTTTSGHSYKWDIAVFTIFSVDRDGVEKVLYKKDDFTASMKPQDISVDITGADFIRFEWRDTIYYDTGAACPLFMLGQPTLFTGNDF